MSNGFLASCRRFSQVWYIGYAFQGISALGLIPIFLPLFVGNIKGPFAAGLLVAIFYFAQMFTPVMGYIIDRLNWHRQIYVLGFILIGVGSLCLPLTSNLSIWILLAFMQGLGIGATNTASGMYVIEFNPESEWDMRVGWLQTLYGTGQALGLLAAAALSHSVKVGLYTAGVMMIPGLIFGLLDLPATKSRQRISKLPHQPRGGNGRSVTGIFGRFNTLHLLLDLRKTAQVFGSLFGLCILMWFFIMAGNWLIYNLYPLLMLHVYHLSSQLSSLYYGIGATVGVAAYPLSGWLAKKIGETRVLSIGILMCLVSVTVLSFLAYWPIPGTYWLVPTFFVLLPIAWSPLIVVGTSIITKLTNMDQGDALGIFNGTTALASLLAALAAGVIAQNFGFRVVMLLSLAMTAISLVLVNILNAKYQKPPTDNHTQV